MSLFKLPCQAVESDSGFAKQDNPFLQMASKKYADYSLELLDQYNVFFSLDTIEARKVIRKVEEAAQKTGSMEWKLHSDYFKLLMFDLKRSLYGNHLYPEEEMLNIALALLEQTKKKNFTSLELIVRQKIIDYYWIYFKNYESAFELYAIQDKLLQTVSFDDFPEKSNYFRLIADAFYEFKDWPRAIFYFNMVLEEKDNINNDFSKQHARNGIGLSYHYGYNDLDRSDSCFYSIMQVEYVDPRNEYYRDNWNGIAEGNLGYNMLLRGEYGKAISLLLSSIEKMLRYGDYAYASGPAVNLADIYLKEGNMSEAKYYLDMAREYYQKMPRNGRLPRIYEVLSKYYTAIGNTKLSMAYMDSTLKANRQYEEQFNTMLLLRMEQKESTQRQQELIKEKEIRQQIQHQLLIFIIAFIIILVLLGLLYVFYRRKQAAYRSLVRKSQEWAQVQTEIVEPVQLEERTDSAEALKDAVQIGIPDETDLSIIKAIEQLMLGEKRYKDYSLSIDSLANTLGIKRYLVSGVINRCAKKSFNTFINEFRIKEAIRLLSEKENKTIHIDDIAYDSGFNDRKNFYRVFKKMTGLSPTEFRNNSNT